MWRRIQAAANLASSETPYDQFSGERSSDGLLVIEYCRDLDGRRQRQHLGTSDVMLAQVKYDEVGVAVERILNTDMINQSINQFLKWPKWHSHYTDH